MKTAEVTASALPPFFEQLRFRLDLVEQTRAGTDLLLATRFNVFEYIAPDENGLSDILRDLLDPRGRHGQGSKFLELLLRDSCSVLNVNCSHSDVRREATTAHIDRHRRRMDVFVDLGDFGVVIENKPWAGEQADQIKDYVKELRQRFGERFAILYLSPTGSDPVSLPEAEREQLKREKKLFLVSYTGELIRWLETCYKECRAEKVRCFLQDFIAYVKETFQRAPHNE